MICYEDLLRDQICWMECLPFDNDACTNLRNVQLEPTKVKEIILKTLNLFICWGVRLTINST